MVISTTCRNYNGTINNITTSISDNNDKKKKEMMMMMMNAV